MRTFLSKVLPAAVCAAAINVSGQAPKVPEPPPHFEEEEQNFSIGDKRVTVKKFPPGQPAPGQPARTVPHPAGEIRSFGFATEMWGRQVDRPLIIRTTGSEENTKVNEQLQEDLSVMSRILDKAAGEHRHRVGMDAMKAAGIEIRALAGRGRQDQALYLEDYGVIFTLNVNMPLRAEPVEEKEEVKEPARNEEWEDARNELFGNRKRPGKIRVQGRIIDQGEIDEFRDELIESLKNTVNIRNLKETDTVLVVVRGSQKDFAEEMEVFQLDYGNGVRAEPRSILATRSGASTMVLQAKYGALMKAAKEENPDLKKIVKVSVY
jgi:hypothetical protein